ncbi:hypothetical protein BKA70DRAFT_1230998 [Coprinopsis sp. MPI-PUGE-AT-0042]|nr:hypothetical protein BKA70DRAFT_1230998 [Coprinopsis sp. MPI-PUGE-AT-0042]
MSLADVLVTLWSHLISFWLLISQSFYFKYHKALDIAITKEGRADGGLDLEIKDFTNGMTRSLEITALNGAGRLSYCTDWRVITSIHESDSNSRSGDHPDSSTGVNVPESTSANVIIKDSAKPSRRPRTARRNRPSVSPSSQQFGESPTKKGLSSII